MRLYNVCVCVCERERESESKKKERERERVCCFRRQTSVFAFEFMTQSCE